MLKSDLPLSKVGVLSVLGASKFAVVKIEWKCNEGLLYNPFDFHKVLEFFFWGGGIIF